MDVLIPKFQGLEAMKQKSLLRQLREGTNLDSMLEKERHYTRQRMIKAAQEFRNYERPKGSEWNLTGVIDARTFFRWMQTDPDFWKCETNWKNFKRDNPEVTPWKP